MHGKSLAVDEDYKDHITGLKPQTRVWYYKRVKDNIFANLKGQGNTLFKLTTIVGKHTNTRG